jgi:hypothetical protein
LNDERGESPRMGELPAEPPALGAEPLSERSAEE